MGDGSRVSRRHEWYSFMRARHPVHDLEQKRTKIKEVGRSQSEEGRYRERRERWQARCALTSSEG